MSSKENLVHRRMHKLSANTTPFYIRCWASADALRGPGTKPSATEEWLYSKPSLSQKAVGDDWVRNHRARAPGMPLSPGLDPLAFQGLNSYSCPKATPQMSEVNDREAKRHTHCSPSSSFCLLSCAEISTMCTLCPELAASLPPASFLLTYKRPVSTCVCKHFMLDKVSPQEDRQASGDYNLGQCNQNIRWMITFVRRLWHKRHLPINLPLTPHP